MNKDITHITIWWFFFVMGGAIGVSTNMFYVLSVGLILGVAAMIVRRYFGKKVEEETSYEYFE